VLFTRDQDFLVEATYRQRNNILFQGVIYAHQLGVSVSTCITDLEILAKSQESEDLMNQLWYLPL
jgi:hypothetical protein